MLMHSNESQIMLVTIIMQIVNMEVHSIFFVDFNYLQVQLNSALVSMPRGIKIWNGKQK